MNLLTELKPEPEVESVPEQEEEPEPELTDGQRHIWNCKTVIDNVRHEEFGVGMQLDEKSRQLMERHQERIGRSLQRLSEELYSKDTHFVLELIQNADDNKYDVGTEPSLVFVVDKEAVTSMNNERGFSEQDIRALCDVGKSTKGKHKHGYIGMLVSMREGFINRALVGIELLPSPNYLFLLICLQDCKYSIKYKVYR